MLVAVFSFAAGVAFAHGHSAVVTPSTGLCLCTSETDEWGLVDPCSRGLAFYAQEPTWEQVNPPEPMIVFTTKIRRLAELARLRMTEP